MVIFIQYSRGRTKDAVFDTNCLILRTPRAMKQTISVLHSFGSCNGEPSVAATGRNGGHIKVALHEAFSSLRLKIGDERGAEIMRFQMRHVDVLVELCEKERIYAAECRRAETMDIFLDGDAFEETKRKGAGTQRVHYRSENSTLEREGS